MTRTIWWNGRNFANFLSKPDRRKCPSDSPGERYPAFFSAGPTRSPVSTRVLGECNAIRNRWYSESDLTYLTSLDLIGARGKRKTRPPRTPRRGINQCNPRAGRNWSLSNHARAPHPGEHVSESNGEKK